MMIPSYEKKDNDEIKNCIFNENELKKEVAKNWV